MIEVVRLDHSDGSNPLGLRRAGTAATATFLAECPIDDAVRVEELATSLPGDERVLADGFPSRARRIGFLAGRLALHAALAQAKVADCGRAILRDDRGRPQATFAGAPPFSIAHSRRRAMAIVAPMGSCRTIGIDVEEVEEQRAHALWRMALSSEELARLHASDPSLVEGPLAAWCAREACVKARGLEVGWFGTALVIEDFKPLERAHLEWESVRWKSLEWKSLEWKPSTPPRAAWRIALRLDVGPDDATGAKRAPAQVEGALAWRAGDAIVAVAIGD